MAFRHVAGTTLVPLLSRLVLGAAFLTVGANKLLETHQFTPEQNRTLEAAGVQTRAVVTRDADADAEARAGGARALPAAFTASAATGQEAEAIDAANRAAEALQEGAAAGAATSEAAEDVDPAGGDEVVPLPDDGSRYEARKLHTITLLVAGADWPMPKYLAWVAAITEFVGGAALLLGLLTRFWAMGLAIAMGVAFHLVSMGINQIHTMDPFAFALDIPRYTTAVSQLALFAMAFGLVLTGAGAVSVDRIIFGSGGGVSKETVAAAPPPVQPAPVYAAQPAPVHAAPAPQPIPVDPAPSSAPAPAPAPAGTSMPPQPKRVTPPPAPLHPDSPPPTPDR